MLCCVGLAACSSSVNTKAPFAAYEDGGHTVRIQYRNNWTKDHENQKQDTVTDVVLLSAPDKRANVGILEEQLPTASVSLASYTAASLQNVKQSVASNAKVSDPQPSTLAGLPAQQVTIDQNVKDKGDLHQVQTYVIKNGVAYAITTTVGKSDQSRWDDTLNTMVQSFQIIAP